MNALKLPSGIAVDLTREVKLVDERGKPALAIQIGEHRRLLIYSSPAKRAKDHEALTQALDHEARIHRQGSWSDETPEM